MQSINIHYVKHWVCFINVSLDFYLSHFKTTKDCYLKATSKGGGNENNFQLRTAIFLRQIKVVVPTVHKNNNIVNKLYLSRWVHSPLLSCLLEGKTQKTLWFQYSVPKETDKTLWLWGFKSSIVQGNQIDHKYSSQTKYEQ